MLDWSISLFRIARIQLAVHVSFFLLLGYVAWEGWNAVPEARWLGLAWSVTYTLLAFTCVVLHELGHAFTARGFGVGVPRILLMPVGGMAEFDHVPREPRQEIAIALAGPAVNFLLIAVLMMFVSLPTADELVSFELTVASLARHLLVINFAMGCFNLVPVFPMDGGRVLRALLAKRLPYVKATFWAATVGKVFALGAIALAMTGMILTHSWVQGSLLALLFAFIFWAGELEYRNVKSEDREAEYWRYRFANPDPNTAASRSWRRDRR
jgi:Zn-dependent protease